MKSLQLGLVGLTDPEHSLVATLFRLHRLEPAFIWALATSAPYDALLVDEACRLEDYRHLVGATTRVMRLSAHGMQREGEMPRPIRSDLLTAWLNAVEVDVLALRQHEAASGFHAIDTLASPQALASDDALVRLRRWPPASLLGKDAGRIRLATMLSRREMSLRELSSLARISLPQCREFLDVLLGQGLLGVSLAPAVPVAATPCPRDSGKAGARGKTSRGVGASLIHSIRRRFGFA